METNKPITYCLKNGSTNSERYYLVAEHFTAEVMQACEKQAGGIADDYMIWLQQRQSVFTHSDRKELLLEILLIGVYLRVYGGYAIGTSIQTTGLMNLLAILRKQGGPFKRISDKLRGYWGRPLLMKNENRHRFMFPSNENFKRLIRWLKSTGEFNSQIPKLESWHCFLKSLSNIECSVQLSVASQLAGWFAIAAEQNLGVYTPQADVFREKAAVAYKRREDAISVIKSSVEYHLNMIGAVIMNQVYSQRFAATRDKILLVPPCMKNVPARCGSEKSSKGDICKSCDPACAINGLTEKGRQHGFDVVIMHHASKPPAWLKNPGEKTNTGIIGVACPVNLISGGWTIAELGFPPQCVLLDHCGCRHWHTEIIPTSLNEHELIRRIKGGNGSSPLEHSGVFPSKNLLLA